MHACRAHQRPSKRQEDGLYERAGSYASKGINEHKAKAAITPVNGHFRTSQKCPEPGIRLIRLDTFDTLKVSGIIVISDNHEGSIRK